MQLEQGREGLRELGEHLFRIVEELTGSRPQWQPTGDWYPASSPAGAFLYFKFVGDRARVRPPQSVMLNARWDDRLGCNLSERGNNWWGEPSADLVVQPGVPEQLARAEAFIRQAYQLAGRQVART